VWQRQAEERQRVEREVQLKKDIAETISKWRMARDVRAYVAEVRALVKDGGLEITGGGSADEELRWALAYADRIDPLTSWRGDIEVTKAEQAGKPCPKCGKVHDPKENPSAPASIAPGTAPARVEPAVDNDDLVECGA
jgi:hypothetical protein